MHGKHLLRKMHYLIKNPAGTQIHNIEVIPGEDRSGATPPQPSGEIRRFKPDSYATVGQVGNLEARTVNVGKAGVLRRRGIRPTVRGTAQNPHSHPHGGGEGRSGVGMKYQKTPWGRRAVGKTRRKYKYSDNMIIEPRKKGSHA
jgi:large subunit ribosomal protein L2